MNLRPNMILFAQKRSDRLKIGMIAAGGGIVGGAVGLYATKKRLTKRQREQIDREKRDVRIWSNVRGMATFESREKRAEAYKRFKKPYVRETQREAMRVGLLRKNEQG